MHRLWHGWEGVNPRWAAATALVFAGQWVAGWGEPADWLPLLVLIGGLLAARTRHLLVGVLAPVAGILLVRTAAGLVSWRAGPGRSMVPLGFHRYPGNLLLDMARPGDGVMEIGLLLAAAAAVALTVALLTYALALGLLGVRPGFALLAVYGALSAWAGHDFRYPGLGLLLRGIRRLRPA